MILKLFDEGMREWVYIDHIAEMRKNDYGAFKLTPYKCEGGVGAEEWNGELVPEQPEGAKRRYFPSRSFYHSKCKEGDAVTVVTVTYEDKKEDGIAFTGDAYLLNDDGKTIERL